MSVQASLSLGAYDLKRYYTRSLAIAFLVSLLFHLFLLGGKEVVDVVMGGSGDGEGEKIAASGPVTLQDFEKEMEEEKTEAVEEVVPPPPPMADVQDLGSGSEGAMGKLVATDVPFEGPDISGEQEMAFSDPFGGGDGGAKAFDPSKINGPDSNLNVGGKSSKGAEPVAQGPDDFVPNAEPPKYDRGQLQSLIEYPEIAKENGLTGKVVISVQVSNTGKPGNVLIRSSSNKIFEESARKAVKKLRFTPATQNGHNIKMWLTFTVEFELD